MGHGAAGSQHRRVGQERLEVLAGHLLHGPAVGHEPVAADGEPRLARRVERRLEVREDARLTVSPPEALHGRRVFVHLDVDVLDNAVLPAQFEAPGGLQPDELRSLLAAIAASAEVVGAEITAYEAPEHDAPTAMLAGAIRPLLEEAG